MRNKLYNAIQSNDMFTENGMFTNSTSGSNVLDLYFKMGAMRSQSESAIIELFENALQENPTLAIKAMFYNRDIRGGQGERRSFRVMFEYLCNKYPEIAVSIFQLVPEYGRWDDLLVATSSEINMKVVKFIYDALISGNVLAKKWMPREGKKNEDMSFFLMDAMGLDAQQYRNLISLDGEVVENLMCSNKWTDINYSHVPSIASKNYRKAFGRHDAEGYGDYLSKLEKGDKSVKINAGAIFPNDIIKSYLNDRRSNQIDGTIEAQWKALPDFVPDDLNFIVVADTSGSMHGDIAWEVAYSLAIYLGERNKSVFKDAFITFSRIERLVTLSGATLREKVTSMLKNEIVENTNLDSVFNLILNKAKEYSVPEEDMPDVILIISDMQFDSSGAQISDNALQMIRRKYESAGYKLPQVIFWNVRSSNGIPVKFDEVGTAAVSGYSPSVMKNVLSGEVTPLGMMMKTLNSERYAPVEEALLGVLLREAK